MGFLSTIMAPIGRPQAPPPARDIRGPFGGLFNSMQKPLIGDRGPISDLDLRTRVPLRPPVDPRIIPPRPPSIGGIGGINAVPQEPIELETGPVTIGGPKNLGGVGPTPGLNVPQIGNFNLEKMPLLPKRDDFMSIGGPGGGFTDNRTFSPVGGFTDSYNQNKNPFFAAFPDAPTPPVIGTMDVMMFTDPITGKQMRGSTTDANYRSRLKEYLDANPGAMESYQQNVLSMQPPAAQDPTRKPALGDGMTSPSLVGQEIKPTDMDVTPTGIQNPPGTVDPVLQDQRTAELITDPLVRALYFGTADQPGFYNQLQQAGANLIGSDVPLQQTAGLTPLELLARQQAVAGIGGFEPFLQQNRELVNQAIEQSRRAEGLQDPYYTQAEQIYQDTMGAYDPGMTQQFYNPFEDAVVQQTVSDVLEAGEQQDIAARAREIGAGAFGGSRARLGAMERREALGEGLAQALGKIRQQGFSEAQRTGLSEFARQQEAKRTGAQGLIGIGRGRGSAASDLATQLAGFGGQMTGIGQTQEQLRAGQRGELAGFGATGRGIAETGLSRLFQQQMDQQMRPLGVISQIGSLLPGYKQASTQIDSTYGMPKDPTAEGLGAAFSAYAAVAPKGG